MSDAAGLINQQGNIVVSRLPTSLRAAVHAWIKDGGFLFEWNEREGHTIGIDGLLLALVWVGCLAEPPARH